MNIKKLFNEGKISKRNKETRFVLSLIEENLITEEQLAWQGCFRILNPNDKTNLTDVSFIEVGKTWHRVVYPINRHGETYDFKSIQENINVVKEKLHQNNFFKSEKISN